MNARPELRAEKVVKRYGGFVALREVSATFTRGSLTSIIGPNGAGKSTFFNVLCGGTKPTSGRILLGNDDITRVPQHKFSKLGIAKSFQITSVFPQLSVTENVRLAAQAVRGNRYDLWTPKDDFPELAETSQALLATVGLDTRGNEPAGTLAHGQQRSLEIAMALASAPTILLLDEPTAGMSPEETTAVMALIRKLADERTIVLVEHKMKLVLGISERVLVLHHGELIADGTPDEIRRDAHVRSVYLGERQ